MPRARPRPERHAPSGRGESRAFTDVAETLETLAEHAHSLFRYDAICLLVWDFARDVLRPGLQRGLGRSAAATFAGLNVRRGSGAQWDRLLDQRAGVITFTPAERDPAQRIWQGWGAVHALPLRHSLRLHGAVCLLYRKPRSKSRIPGGASLPPWAATAAMALNLAQLAEHERAAVKNVAMLADSLRDLTAPWELREVLGRLCERVRESLAARACAVLLRSASERATRIAGLAGSSADFAALAHRRRLPDLPSPFPDRGYLVVSPDIASHLLPIDTKADRLGRTLVAPLVRDGQALGAIAVVARQGKSRFTDEDIRFVQACADQAAVAVETARLYQREREAAERAQVLLQIATAPPGPFDREAYLRQIAERARAVLNATECSVWLRALAGDDFELAARSPADQRSGSRRLAKALRLPLVAFDPWTARFDPTTRAIELQPAARSALAPAGGLALLAPIQAGSRVLGALVAAGSGRNGELDDGDAHMLAGIADVTALRLQQEDLLRHAARRERDLARHRERERIARDLHDTVLQTLATINIQIAALEHRGRPVDTGQLAPLRCAVLDQFRTIERVLKRLREPQQQPVDLRAEIEAVVDDYAARGQLRASIRTTGVHAIESGVAHEVAFIVREALANVSKHANTTDDVDIDVAVHAGVVHARVRDQGRGFPASAIHAGHVRREYLPWSIRERVSALQGQLRIESRAGHGTVVSVWVPYGSDATTSAQRKPPAWSQRRSAAERQTRSPRSGSGVRVTRRRAR